jgi:hypothetical protein
MTTSDADYASLANKDDNYFLYPIRKLSILSHYEKELTEGKR